jgi:hypothetical protein
MYRLIMEVNEECGFTDTASSSDEDDAGFTVSSKSQCKQQIMKTHTMLDCGIGLVLDTFAPRPPCQPFASSALSDSGLATGLTLCT